MTSARPRLRRERGAVEDDVGHFAAAQALGTLLAQDQRTASTILLLPEPLGPTMAVMPWPKSKTVLSAKLLKPQSWSVLSMIDCQERVMGPVAADLQVCRVLTPADLESGHGLVTNYPSLGLRSARPAWSTPRSGFCRRCPSRTRSASLRVPGGH